VLAISQLGHTGPRLCGIVPVPPGLQFLSSTAAATAAAAAAAAAGARISQMV